MAVLQWVDGDMIVHCVIDGLMSNLKDKITQSGSNLISLGDLVRFIIPLNNRLFQHKQERKRETKDAVKPSTIGNSSVALFTHYAQPTKTPTVASTNIAQPQPNMPKFEQKLRGLLTPEEKQYRRDNGLCHYCGGKDHILENCPLTKTKRPPFNNNIKVEPKNK